MIPNQLMSDELVRLNALAVNNRHRKCKRKAVACSIINPIMGGKETLVVTMNGPLGRHECTNEVGACGCAHAEPEALLKIAPLMSHPPYSLILCCTHLPCVPCANVIIQSRLIGTVVFMYEAPHWNAAKLLLANNHIKVINLPLVGAQFETWEHISVWDGAEHASY